LGIIQKNLYLPGQNLTNLAQNVDYNRLGLDRCNITVDFNVSPANVTIKQGSLIEVNGNLYAIEAADYVFAMANATHNYITFTDNPLPAFSSAASIGTYNNAKLGLYDGTNLIRTLRWYIEQGAEDVYDINDSVMAYNKGGLKTEVNSYFSLTNALGILLSHNDVTMANANPATTTFTGTSFVIKKPCMICIKTAWSSGGVPQLDTLIVDLMGMNNSIYYPLARPTGVDTGGVVAGTRKQIWTVNPGKYRTEGSIKTVGGTLCDFADIDVYLYSVYGQTNLDAASVHA